MNGSCSIAKSVSESCAEVPCRFREDVAVQERMQGIADIITTAGYPTFLCFQEMTPRIMAIFASMPW